MKVITLLASASAVSAHTIFQNLVAGGRDYGQGNGVRIPSYNGPIEDVSSNSMACNGAPNSVASTNTIIDVQAGSEVTALWRYMLSTTGTSPNDIMDSTHKGPTMAYLKKVSNAATDSGVGGGWFKIQEDGFNNGVWGTEKARALSVLFPSLLCLFSYRDWQTRRRSRQTSASMATHAPCHLQIMTRRIVTKRREILTRYHLVDLHPTSNQSAKKWCDFSN